MSRRANRGKRAQILIAAAIVVGILVMNMAVLVYTTVTSEAGFQEPPYAEAVQSLDSDFRRALTRILALTTQTYNSTLNMSLARNRANEMLTDWLLVATSTFVGYGTRITPSWTQDELQPAKTIGGYLYSTRILSNLTKLYWYQPQSLSAIGATISIDMPTIGFYGFKASCLCLLNLTINVASIEQDKKDGTISFELTLLKEGQQPVLDLELSNLFVWTYDPTSSPTEVNWKPAIPVDLEYEGEGLYLVVVSPQFGDPKEASSFWKNLYQHIRVEVSDSRGIAVEAYSYCGIDLEFEEDSGIRLSSDQSIRYIVEALTNGTMLWFGRELENKPKDLVLQPLPPVPTTQFSVVVRSSLGNWTKVPVQIESWEPGGNFPVTDYKRSVQRFLNGYRLVFPLDFSATKQTIDVRITWKSDCDLGSIDSLPVLVGGDSLMTIDNGRYVARIPSGIGPTEWQNYTVSIEMGGYHSEYWLFGYDSAGSGNETLVPRKALFGEWEALNGPVRSVVFRRSDVVFDRLTKTTTTLEVNHETVIFIPRNQSYFYWQLNLQWKKSFTMSNRFVRLFAVTSGPGMDFGSLLQHDEKKTVNGTFASSMMMHRDRRYNHAKDYGYWCALYRQGLGSAIIVPESTLDMLDKEGHQDQLWVWTSASLDRTMEYDMFSFNDPPVSYVVDPSKAIVGRGAGWIYQGGTAYYPFNKNDIWRLYPYASPMQISTGVDVPNAYYLMFLDEDEPVLRSSAPF